MLKKLWRKMAGKPAAGSVKHTTPYTGHGLSADDISFAAEKTVSRLQQAGYEAYIVGGAVRDLLIGADPKDFDVATNATPEEIRALFRRSRIIYRRFRIVHVQIGPETIEVTTFRGSGSGGTVQNEQGRIMKDNSYGTLAEDAGRRDFTCNALYFDPVKREIHDFHNGVEDVRQRRIVMIGNPAERYREDPVRILRAVRLAGKLGFTVEEHTAAPAAQYAGRLKEEPPARLFDEITKLLFSGHARRCLDQFRALGIDTRIHPLLDSLQQAAAGGRSGIVAESLKNTDERVRAGKSVSAGFVLAALMWDKLDTLWQKHRQHGLKPAHALIQAMSELDGTMEKGWGVPQKFTATMREIWILQPQFDNRRGMRPHRLLAQPRFRAAYDFLVLRAQTGSAEQELADWWTTFQHAPPEEREKMTASVPAAADAPADSRRKRRRKPRKRKSADADAVG
ncbi:polynucleotide adenylyltransferase PcnB [Kingella potus]|uniref:polynucleotide adenylyltransferase PcnB n=1 Tax=Kingella potus TaxID=265175 RepID=UPI001FD0CC58|nr:polynucleotide adenylyltransferase PcnB [Kingella potus]UOP01642.1 polynucleotide adenylyltransferase PcnB [Kingella potus]